MGEWKYNFTILDLGTRWRWVANFTPRPLYPRYVSVRRLGVPPNLSERCEAGKNYLPLLGNELQPSCPSLYVLAISIESVTHAHW
jgi:hypothetical protein